MGLHLAAITKKKRKELHWLRNPYGLGNWAESNYLFALQQNDPLEEKEALSYLFDKKRQEVLPEDERKLFLDIAVKYGSVLLNLKQGYFFFTESMIEHVVLSNSNYLAFPATVQPSAQWVQYHQLQKRELVAYYGITQESFLHSRFQLFDRASLRAYKLWYSEFLDLVLLLQEPEAIFSCST